MCKEAASRASLDALEARITFSELELAFKDLTLNQQSPSSITMASGLCHGRSIQFVGFAGHTHGGRHRWGSSSRDRST